MAGKRRSGLTSWLLLLVLGIAVPLLIFATLTLTWVAQTSRRASERAQMETTRTLGLAVDAEIRSWRAALLALAETPELRGGRLREFEAIAHSVAARYDGWVVVNDSSGQQLLNTLRPFGEPLPRSAAGEMVTSVFRDGKPVTDLVFGAVAQRYIVSNSVPVFRDGRVVFCLSMNFGPERLSRLLAEQKLSPTWITGVTDSQQRVVARAPHRPERVGQPVMEPLRAAFRAAEQGIVESELTDGRMGRVAFQRLHEVPWVVLVAMPTREIQAAWRTPLLTFLLAGGLLGLLAIVLAIFVGRRIARPIQQLAEASGPLMRGDTAAFAVATPIREVQRLQEAVLAGADAVQAYNQERERAAEALRRANEGLEARVAERTKALAEANAALQQANIQLEQANSEVQEANIHLEEANAELQQEVEERQRAEAARHSVALFPEENPHPIFRVGQDGTLLYANRGSEPLLQKWRVAVGGSLAGTEGLSVLGTLRTGEMQESLVTCGDRTYSLISVPIADAGYANVYGRDVTERKRMEDRLHRALAAQEAALADKDALLREVHHRVKNNLQMLCDLIYLQMETLEAPDTHLQDAYSRIYAIARLHEQLYQSMQSGRVQLGEYLGRLVDGFGSLYPAVPVTVEATDPVALDLDRAIHVGLIVNELVTNALKHAFTGREAGEITVSVRAAGDRLQLQVRDNGRGMPADFDLAQAKSVGLRTVHILARRLEATVAIERKGGTALTLSFPLHADPPIEPKME